MIGWSKVIAAVCFMISGIDLDRALNGGSEEYFGTNSGLWFLAVFMFAIGLVHLERVSVRRNGA
jgi:hypothetical protein